MAGVMQGFTLTGLATNGLLQLSDRDNTLQPPYYSTLERRFELCLFQPHFHILKFHSPAWRSRAFRR